MEVPKAFPTGFYMQPVIKERQWIISSALKANCTVQEWNAKLHALTITDHAESDPEAVYELWLAAWSYVSAGVNGGVQKITLRFFVEDGYYQLNRENKQFCEILQLFNTLEKFIKLMKKSVLQLQKFLRNLPRNYDDRVTKIGVDRIQEILHEYVKSVENIRHTQDIDDLMAAEYDNMDSDDSDW